MQTIADTLEEVEPDFQASLIEPMSDERVADVLEEMAPDEAADLLAELPEERSQDLLNLMESDEAEDVRKLLAYPEDSAGGIMNTEYIAVGPDLTRRSRSCHICGTTLSEAETIFYIYVVDDAEPPGGRFLAARAGPGLPGTLVSEFMERRLVTVNLADSQDDVAQAISKYNLLAVPVVDDEQHLHGIVTADDALDKIIPTAWKKRLPKLYR